MSGRQHRRHALNALWSGVLIRHGKAHRSAALVADGKNLLADVVTSLQVVVGVVMVVVTHIAVLDATTAAPVALHVLWSGWKVTRDSTNSVLDEAAPANELDTIRDVIAQNAGKRLRRTRHAGKAIFLKFHLVVPGKISVRDSHETLRPAGSGHAKGVKGAIITIHVEPDEAKQTGAACFERAICPALLERTRDLLFGPFLVPAAKAAASASKRFALETGHADIG